MRKNLVYNVMIFYGFLIVSVLYCMLYDLITRNPAGACRYSLFLLPVVVLCSLGAKKIGSAVIYFLLCLGLFAFVVLGAGAMGLIFREQIILFWFSVGIAGSYYVARASRRLCWLEKPAYPILMLYFSICLHGSYMKNDFLVKLTSFAAGISYLAITLHINEQKIGDFLFEYSAMERLPIQRMKQNNSRMIWLCSGITAVVMIVAPYLKINELIRGVLKIFQMLIHWFLGFFSGGEEVTIVEEMPQQAAVDFGFLQMEEGESPFWKVMEKVLEMAGWIAMISLMVVVAFLTIRKLLQLYQQFNDRVEENGDVVENIRNSVEEKLKLKKSMEEFLFFRRSPDARIRKHYKKRIEKDNKEEIKETWTPKELETAVTLSAEQKECFHKYYEKARYAEESCSKDEMQEMLHF